MSTDFRIVDDSWRAAHFGLAPERPRRDRPSNEMEAVRELMRRRDESDARVAAGWQAHARSLGEREAIERWRADVEEHGSAAVERIVRRGDPTFQLPAVLRGIEPRGSKS